MNIYISKIKKCTNLRALKIYLDGAIEELKSSTASEALKIEQGQYIIKLVKEARERIEGKK